MTANGMTTEHDGNANTELAGCNVAHVATASGTDGIADTVSVGTGDMRALRHRCDELASSILEICVQHQLRIAAAESLTGGLIADSFVRIPGASRVFLGSAVTYDIAAKASILGVDRTLLNTQGAFHPEVARQMAVATARLYMQPEYRGRVIGLSTTGVAGPGPDGSKPAGLVYIGIAMPACGNNNEQVEAIELRLHGSREQVRNLTVLHLLENLSQFSVFSQE